MNDWWKNPVLQGPDNEYGEYDYLIEELPHDYVKWDFSKYKGKCDSCGKERHLLLRSAHYFYTLDGYDYMNYDECWVCRLNAKVWSVKQKVKRLFSILKLTFEFWHLARIKGNKENFIGVYKFINAMHK